MQPFSTLNELFLRIARRGDTTVALWSDKGEWKPITSQELYGRVCALAEVLQGWGIQRGDRVALISENRWEWPVVDFAVLAIGAVGVPMYHTLTPEQQAVLVKNSGARAIFVADKTLYKKVVAMGEIPTLEKVVVFDEGEFDGAIHFSSLMTRAKELEAADAAFDQMLAAAKPEDLASIIYTSGTTGDPKGVMLTHANFSTNLMHSTDDLQIVDGDVSISFLPLSHVTARHLDYALYGLGAVIAYCPSLAELPKAMKTVKPTVFLAVPRLYERIRQTTESRATGFKKKILNWALATGSKHRKELMAGKTPWSPLWKLAHKLVYSKIAEAFGGRAKVFVAGGAPLGMDTINWFLDAGIRIFEGYGLTETSPVIARNTFRRYYAGSVGDIVPNMECRIAADGELEVYGPAVFGGYWNNEQATREAFTEDGWFKTGDIARMEDNFLWITDRKKELIKTSQAKFVAPQPIENKLKANTLVAQAALVGDQQKYISVLIQPNFEALETWAKENGVTAGDRKALVADAKVVAAYRGIVQGVNKTLANFEIMKRITVVADEWTIEGGELTPSMKLKRRVILERYAKEIAGMYSGGGDD